MPLEKAVKVIRERFKNPWVSENFEIYLEVAFCGALVNGKSIYDALVIAANYTTACIKNTYNDPGKVNYAVNFELEIPYLLKLLRK